VLDRATAKIVFMASQAGGMEIEKVAKETPELIYKETIEPALGLQPYQARRLAFKLGLEKKQINQAVSFMMGLYKAFVESDASLMEINPFITTKDGSLMLWTARSTSTTTRCSGTRTCRSCATWPRKDPLEVQASKFNLNYIKLDGNIACMVNGAGLAMATMDIISYAGGSPANFLDVGGSASQEQIENAFEILLSDPNVKAIFINIFGGILRVDILASAVVEATKKLNVKLPIILRLEGTNVEEGRKILAESGIKFQVGATMKEAADLAVAAAKGGK